MLSHTTAAWWWRLFASEPRVVHVTTTKDRKSVPGVRVHRVREVEATTHNGHPVTTVPWTLLDLAGMVEFAQLRRALAEADYRGVLDVAAVAAMLGRGRTGSCALRAALEIHLPELAKTRSLLEERFLPLCEEAGLPIPDVNATIDGEIVDALWRGPRLIVELDGGAAHSSVARMRRDRARDLGLRERGYRVLRYSATQVRREPERVIADIRRNLRATAP